MSVAQQTQPNPNDLDLRLLKVDIAINGKVTTYNEAFAITVKGTKYANPIQNECEVSIANLKADTRNFILTETSPYNSNEVPKTITVSAGRISTGYAQVYTGDITTSLITQPPDILLTLKCATGQFLKGKLGTTKGLAKQKLSGISAQVAQQLGLKLNFQATDKFISNYAYSGAQLKQINKLGDAGGVTAYQDDGQLVVKDLHLPLPDAVTKLDEYHGMIGIPEVTEQGVKVKFLFDSVTKLGGAIQLTSQLNPAANGYYIIFKLEFDLTSRDTSFYMTAQCQRISA